jgi:drug/metabolite transporter (DMT)-like permease
MIALLGGLGAALCWTVSALCASAASRSIGSASTLAWVMGLGLVLIALPTALLAPLSQLTPRTVALIALAGGTNVIGLRIEYVAFRRGKVGVISAIASTEGVIAAVIAVAFGAHLAVWTTAVLLAVAVGVVLAAWHPDPEAEPASGVRSAVLAIPVALLFGVTLYATGRVGSEASVLWVLVPARLFGTVFIMAPLRLRGTLRLTGRALPLVAAAAAGEVVGIVSYELGARHGLAVAAVLSSQFAALAALGAFLLFRERLSRSQVAGLVVIAAGVGLLAAGQG